MRIVIAIILGLMFVNVSLANSFTLTSTAVADNGKMPHKYSCDMGKSQSPELSWKNAPTDTQSFVLILDTTYWSTKVYLWVLYNIPANLTELPEGANSQLPAEITEGENFYEGEPSYHPPCPPDDHLRHYVFTVYALDTILDLAPELNVDKVMHRMQGHILQKAQLHFTFQH